ncbi:MAG: acetylxylan esterase [Candidatus Solibacter sp.]|nr:acetylxylan esterase [Candidatus Solibacter sp.]
MRHLTVCLMLAGAAFAQPPGTNYDESKVPGYTLPELLKLNSGEAVKDAKTWREKRRPEVFSLLEGQMFGKAPGRHERMTFELTSLEPNALGGKAVRKEIAITTAGKTMSLLLYLPKDAKGPAPVFLGLNFQGNHAVTKEAGVKLAMTWPRTAKEAEAGAKQALETSRGAAASRWPVELILSKGYGLATIYYCDIEPDFNGGMKHGVRPHYLRGKAEAPDDWAAIAAWAWGLSRAMDYLENDRAVDAKKVAVMGHSRLGKTSLWAGAADERFAIVISNNSGEGGAAISRRMFGENVKNLNTSFPHWFTGNYKQYNERVAEMGFDSHMLIGLIAPRPVYIASAEEDRWADPRGEFLGAAAASPVWRLYGKKGIETDKMPGLHEPVGDAVGYHIRAGKHDVTDYDWEQWIRFADRHFGRR